MARGMSDALTRRALARRAFAAGLVLTPFAARAETPELTPLPQNLDLARVPGLAWAGAGPQAVEVFDYNCPYCRAAFLALDALVQKKKLRLGLIDCPVLSIGSIQAAKARQAVLRLHGPAKAYEYHRRLYAQRGMIDGERALAAAREMRLDVDKMTEAADGDDVRNTIVAQARFLDSIHAQTTPSFLLRGGLIAGWPGAEDFEAALNSA
jgi:protein-disulfide isomerase